MHDVTLEYVFSVFILSLLVFSGFTDLLHVRSRAPRAAGAFPFPLSIPFLVCCSFFIFPFLGGFNYFFLLSIPFLSNRIVPLRFQAGGRRKRPNLGLVCCVYFVLSVFIS